MSRIGRLGQEIAEKIRNKVNSGVFNNRQTQRTIDTLTLPQDNQDTFEKFTSNGAVIDLTLELQDDTQENCEEFMDNYAYNPLYEQEHEATIPKEILNIIA